MKLYVPLLGSPDHCCLSEPVVVVWAATRVSMGCRLEYGLAAALKRKPTVAIQTRWPFRHIEASSTHSKGLGDVARALRVHCPEKSVSRRSMITHNGLNL